MLDNAFPRLKESAELLDALMKPPTLAPLDDELSRNHAKSASKTRGGTRKINELDVFYEVRQCCPINSYCLFMLKYSELGSRSFRKLIQIFKTPE